MLIALDMDGTLLNEEGRISSTNREAIINAQNLGHIVIIATGRSFMDAERQLRLADLECPVVSLNGALVTLVDGTLAASKPLNKEDIIPALRWMNEIPDLYYEVYTKDNVYVELNKRVRLEKIAELKDETITEEVSWLLKVMIDQQFLQASVTYVESMEEVWAKEDNIIYKTLAFSLDRALLKEAAERFEAIPGLIITASHVNNIEINNLEANKGSGITLIANHFGIPLSEVAVMGDSYNDKPMFEVAGYRIAMANAAPVLKEMAEFVTTSNDEDGVAVGLEYLLNLNRESQK